MKKIHYIILFLLFSVIIFQFANADDIKWIRYGDYQAKVTASGDMGEGGLGWDQSGYCSYDNFEEAVFNSHAHFLGAKNWTDTSGTFFPVRITGCGQWDSDKQYVWMPLTDAAGFQIYKYVQYQPSMSQVDGHPCGNPFPQNASDIINPDKIDGSAYCMLESWANSDMGITLHQKVYSWAQEHHDDYLIYDWTFINTGNVDLDDEIELPDQTLEDVYFLRQERAGSFGEAPWMTSYGEELTDSLRVFYSYPATSKSPGSDPFGGIQEGDKFLRDAVCRGAAILHVDKSCDDHSNDPAQPTTSAIVNCDLPSFTHGPSVSSESDKQVLYDCMENGFLNFPDFPMAEYDGGWNQSDGMHKSVRFDELGYEDVFDCPYTIAVLSGVWSVGPYQMAPGDSFRVVFALAWGAISIEKANEVAIDWNNGTATFPGEIDLPEQFSSTNVATDANDLAKDAWVYSGVDTLFRNLANAKWAVEHDYNVPTPPPAPILNVASRPDSIVLSWYYNDPAVEEASDFAGFRVYRAHGNSGPRVTSNDSLVGVWERIYECGKEIHRYQDTEPVRGENYFYYVAAYDDGSLNGPDARSSGGEILESGMYFNRTTYPASLTRAPGESLDSIRVVPNPFSMAASGIQYAGAPNKLVFMDIPPFCDIRIYTVSGDLITTIHHDDGSGDQPWGVIDEAQQASGLGQRIVSGVYIAYIEVTKDEGNYKKGDNTIVKFVIVR